MDIHGISRAWARAHSDVRDTISYVGIIVAIGTGYCCYQVVKRLLSCRRRLPGIPNILHHGANIEILSPLKKLFSCSRRQSNVQLQQEVERLKTQLAEKDEALMEKDALEQEKNEHIAGLTSQLAASQKKVAKLEEKIQAVGQAKNKYAKTLRLQLQEERNENEELQRKMYALEKQVKALQSEQVTLG